jgi:dipeptidyl aminopeptidase/acylaminoacyl peptidase
MRLISGLFLVCMFVFGSDLARAEPVQEISAKKPLTVADTIETKELMQFPGGKAVLISPDGKRYLLAVRQGDLKRNGTWQELYSGGTASLEDARPQLISRMFTTNTGEDKPTHIAFSRIEWMSDSKRVAMLWSGGGTQAAKIMTVDVRTRRVETLTHHPTNIIQFKIAEDDSILYSALAPHSKDRAKELLRDGFAVSSTSIYPLLEGDVDGWQQWLNYQTFLSSGTKQSPRKIVVNGRGDDHWWPNLAEFSPGDDRVIVEGQPQSFPKEWDRYTGEEFRSDLHQGQRDPDARVQIFQAYVIDVKRGTSRPLWAAPLAWGGGRALWSPEGNSVVVGPTYLPLDNGGAAGVSGDAFAEVDIESGKFQRIPIPSDLKDGVSLVRWDKDGVLEVGDSSTRLFFKKKEGQWQTVTESDATTKRVAAPAVRLEVREDPNTPPALFAIEVATGQEKMLLDLNPRLRTDFSLGRVEIVKWNDKEGREWHGRLYYPVHYSTGHRYPLVIQTHGFSATEFSLLGVAILTSDYAAQPLANQDIAVLQVEDKEVDGINTTPKEPEMYMGAYEAAVNHLSDVGLVDRDRVGLQGFSRTGWYVEYILTHSSFPYAAANIADNIDASYFQAGLRGGWSDEFVLDNGGAPYGEGLKKWLENTPGFNADKIRTPLRMQVDSGDLPFVVINGWEMFTRLRDLQKPVEYYVVPDIKHGTHNMVIPRQQLASRSGFVDWMAFWLNDTEDPDPRKAEQYKRWHELKLLQKNNNVAGQDHPSLHGS